MGIEIIDYYGIKGTVLQRDRLIRAITWEKFGVSNVRRAKNILVAFNQLGIYHTEEDMISFLNCVIRIMKLE